MHDRQNSAGGGDFLRKNRIRFIHAYDDIISVDSLLEAWQEFVRGKRSRKDVQEFEGDLMANILSLHRDLKSGDYRHSPYEFFKINDPKPRDIHKASVRDRLLHHAIYRKLYPFFDRTFIADSFSCRLWKGTHKAMDRFKVFARRVSCNHTKTVWVLKCDIRKFFASVDQQILLDILALYIPDKNILRLLEEIISSFHSAGPGTGLPLGNLTSQLLVNIYMNKFDRFVKHQRKVRYYIRYADDFVIFSQSRDTLISLIPRIQDFLWTILRLKLHPDKISVRTIASGVDYLGWVHFTNHRVIRTATKRRMLKRINDTGHKKETVQSYLGLLSHGNARKLQNKISGA
ncbi:MAG: group II intron reverse transcriptase domain-containing protein [Patescibacteria group bacterium]|nr:group II intron reverse transcriptase domain-containing protein [Patescibacteria group bacterium]